MTKNIVIIGGGVAGCTAAHQLKCKFPKWDIKLFEIGNFLGAGVRTFYYGGHPYTFGPRHFLTQNEKVYDYMNSLCPLRDCGDHQFITYVEKDNAFYNYPIHEDDIKSMPDFSLIDKQMKEVKGVAHAKNLEDYWIGSVGKILYDKFILNYNKKMWLVDNNKKIDTFNWSPKGVNIKKGPRAAWDNAISAYPYASDGYNVFFDKCTADIEVNLNKKVDKFDLEKNRIKVDNHWIEYDFLINSISPDELFEKCYGELKFLGRDFHKIVFPTENVFPEDVYFLYYANEEKFTRLVEYKRFTKHNSPTTLVGMEIPSLNGKHYPLPFISEQNLARKYFLEMPKNVFSIGRAGSYRYGLDIDDCIEQSMIMTENIISGDRDYPVPMKIWQD